MDKIAVIGAGFNGDDISPTVKWLESIIMKDFNKSVGKLIIMHPGQTDFGDMISRMKELNPNLEIELVNDLAGHRDLLIVNGTTNQIVARSMEIKIVETIDPYIEARQLAKKHSLEQKRDNRYRSQRHNFNPKNYRR